MAQVGQVGQAGLVVKVYPLDMDSLEAQRVLVDQADLEGLVGLADLVVLVAQHHQVSLEHLVLLKALEALVDLEVQGV